MNSEFQPLFRREALRFQADRLEGNVSLVTPLHWQVVGVLLLAAFLAAAVFLFLGSYTRSESAPGIITLNTGVAAVVPSRAGVIAGLEVREGQRVEAGAPLVRIRSEEDMLSGATAPDRIRQALLEQDARLSAQSAFASQAATADRARLAAQADGLTKEIASLGLQIRDQQRLVEITGASFAEIQRVAADGFISRRDVEAREAAFIAQRQQLAQLRQARDVKTAELSETRRSIAKATADALSQSEGARSVRAGLAQQLAQADSARGYTLSAPMAGVATAVVARPGQTVTPDQPLMMIVPATARLTAEIYVPTSAAGFLAPGQPVRLAVDAFPYQRFGTVDGRIVSISSAAVARPSANGTVPAYLATVELSHPWVSAFGRRQPLLPGMTLNARIITERRSLIEWLFEPLLAVRRR